MPDANIRELQSRRCLGGGVYRWQYGRYGR
jgi:hypothetical protein